jgi:hypothetical protein
MGKPKKRLNPKVKNRVNRRILRMASKKVKKIVSKLPEPWNRNTIGRPSHEPKMVVAMCILKVLLCKTYDSVDELADDPRIQSILGTTRLPGHSVVHRGMLRLSMEYLRMINRELAAEFEMELVEIIVDSTGFRLMNSSSWYDMRIKRRNRRKDNIKLHIVCCARTGIVLYYKITKWYRNDSAVFKQLIKELKRFDKAVGDAGYISVENCDIVAKKGGKPYFMLKKSVGMRVRDEGAGAWNDMVLEFRTNNKEWLDVYHIRSYV